MTAILTRKRAWEISCFTVVLSCLDKHRKLEIHDPRDRYGIIDHEYLSQTLGFQSVSVFQKQHRQWIDEALADNVLLKRGEVVTGHYCRQRSICKPVRRNPISPGG